MIQLNPPIPLETPKGKGMAIFINDPGMEHNLQWTVIIDATCEIWTFQNPEVRAQKNITMGRDKVSSTMTQPTSEDKDNMITCIKKIIGFNKESKIVDKCPNCGNFISLYNSGFHVCDPINKEKVNNETN